MNAVCYHTCSLNVTGGGNSGRRTGLRREEHYGIPENCTVSPAQALRGVLLKKRGLHFEDHGACCLANRRCKRPIGGWRGEVETISTFPTTVAICLQTRVVHATGWTDSFGLGLHHTQADSSLQQDLSSSSQFIKVSLRPIAMIDHRRRCAKHLHGLHMKSEVASPVTDHPRTHLVL